MQRRTLLTSLGGLLAVGAAGCMSAADPSADPSPTTDRPTPTPSDAATPPTDDPGTSGIRPADGVTPVPMPVDLSEIPCPPTAENADRQVCSTTTDLDDAPIALVPPEPPLFEPTTDDDAIETFAVELRNNADATFGFNPYDWAMKRHTADGWVHVAPDMTPEPWLTLEPGDSYTFSLSVESVPNRRIDGSRSIVLDLDSGVYALVVDGLLEAGNDGERIECAAIFAVERDGN